MIAAQPVGRQAEKSRPLRTGVVYEQVLHLLDVEGTVLATFRRVTVELDQPTRDGEREIHVLSNLPARVTALRIAELYRQRWTIETAFQELAANFAGEIETLGYPRAALFAFSMALVTFNILNVVLKAMCSGQDSDADEVSIYYVCDEIAHAYRGLDFVLDPQDWTAAYAGLTAAQLARVLKRLATYLELSRYRKHQRGPKKPPPKMKKTNRNHVSTARILAAATSIS